jgi:hypothetical protein
MPLKYTSIDENSKAFKAQIRILKHSHYNYCCPKIKLFVFAFGQLFMVYYQKLHPYFIKKSTPYFSITTIMSLVKLSIKEFHTVKHKTDYALILNEVDGDRKLPIVIGAFEAQSISYRIRERNKTTASFNS